MAEKGKGKKKPAKPVLPDKVLPLRERKVGKTPTLG